MKTNHKIEWEAAMKDTTIYEIEFTTAEFDKLSSLAANLKIDLSNMLLNLIRLGLETPVYIENLQEIRSAYEDSEKMVERLIVKINKLENKIDSLLDGGRQ